MQKIEFLADDITLSPPNKTNKDTFRVMCKVKLEGGMYEWHKVKDIPLLPAGNYKVTIEPVIIEN